MTLAIGGGRASCLSLPLGPRAHLLAVARGFGRIGGVPTEQAVLTRLRAECARRIRSSRFRHAIDRVQSAPTAILALLERVNGDLYAATASHDDYVTAGSSLTAVLVVAGRAYTMHAGATAAYLVRNGSIVALSADDAFGEGAALLGRAFAAAPVLDAAVSSMELEEGDVIALLGRRLVPRAGRVTLAELEENLEERALLARFERDDEAENVADDAPRRRVLGALRVAIAIGLAAALVFAR